MTTDAPVLFGIQPAPDLVGWCHNCETWQRGEDASVAIWRSLGDVGYVFVCPTCGDEPWGVGVWTCRCADCSDPDDEYGGTADVCWGVTRMACARAGCHTVQPDDYPVTCGHG